MTRAIVVPSAQTSRPGWLASRDAWHNHYFGCDACKRWHTRPTREQTGLHPCEVGAGLLEKYNGVAIWGK